MDIVAELGSDICTDWVFENGDLVIKSNDENLVQVILNRLNITYGELDGFYAEYGTLLYNYFGWRKDDETLSFMQMEIETTLRQDPRLDDVKVNLSYGNDNNVIINLDVAYTEDSDLSLSFVFDGNSVTLNDGENYGN